MEELKKIESSYEKLTVGIKKSQRNSEIKLIEVNNLAEQMKNFKLNNCMMFDQIRNLKYHHFDIQFDENQFLLAIKLKDETIQEESSILNPLVLTLDSTFLKSDPQN